MLGVPETLAPTPADTAVPSPIAVAIHHELSIGGPMTAEELLAALARRGLSVSGNDLEDLLDAGGVPHVVQLGMPDGPAFAALDSVLRGRVFTHRLTAREVAADVLTVEPDLKPLMILTDAPPFDQLADGSPITEVFQGAGVDPNGSLRLPPGSLTGYRPGDLVGVGVGVGGLTIGPVDDLNEPPADLRARVRDLINSRDGEPIMLDELIWRICNSDLELFMTPLPPLADLLPEWQLDRRADYVAPTGSDSDSWEAGARIVKLVGAYQITPDQAMTVTDVIRAVDRLTHLIDPVRVEPADDGSADERPPGDSPAAASPAARARQRRARQRRARHATASRPATT